LGSWQELTEKEKTLRNEILRFVDEVWRGLGKLFHKKLNVSYFVAQSRNAEFARLLSSLEL
jgi:hypothetical protein